MPNPASNSCLVVVDLQEKLAPAIVGAGQALDNCRRLLLAARKAGIPVLLSAQYSKGLGDTVQIIRELVDPADRFEKITFSCLGQPEIAARLTLLGRKRAVVLGMEAHVCVLQTALALIEAGYEVSLVADAVGSRDPANAEAALARLARAGASIVLTDDLLNRWDLAAA